MTTCGRGSPCRLSVWTCWPRRKTPTMRTEVSRQFAGELCAFWRERYEAVVLDLPDVRAAVDCGFTALADIILLVTTNELAALQATRRSLRYLDAGAGDRAKLRLILNRHTPVTGLKREEVNTALAHAALRHPLQRLRSDPGGPARRQAGTAGFAIRRRACRRCAGSCRTRARRKRRTHPGLVPCSTESKS